MFNASETVEEYLARNENLFVGRIINSSTLEQESMHDIRTIYYEVVDPLQGSIEKGDIYFRTFKNTHYFQDMLKRMIRNNNYILIAGDINKNNKITYNDASQCTFVKSNDVILSHFAHKKHLEPESIKLLKEYNFEARLYYWLSLIDTISYKFHQVL